MLFIREYDTKSLDRSSVSMIDKYNTRLNRVSELLDELSSTVDVLLSLVRDIRNTLGQCKQRVYNNLDQVKEVVSGNGITGTESTIDAIEGALATGDRAINDAEIQLENIQNAIDCSEEYSVETDGTIECGESCNQTANTPTTEPGSCSEPYSSDCSFCSFDNKDSEGFDNFDCTVCSFGDCDVSVDCDEACGLPSGSVESCGYSSYTDIECGETYNHNGDCSEYDCIFHGSISGDCENNYGIDCTFTCDHTSSCSEYAMPENCTYSCADYGECAYGDGDCTYASSCGQDFCNESSCSQYDCGEPCGETCHMTIDCSEDCSEDSCGECSDELSEDDYYGGDDCGEACGEDCGDSCGL